MELTITAGEASVEWCDDCALPSVITFGLYGLDEDAGVLQVGTYRQCQRCD